ncbi:putative membrane protein [Photobacterium leiognathi lrivu.4.1]|uniref:Putative membrane protein n=1 Tax=Photobacterium leiognathi lrivu.4.1 TaxID=1248232 RepID=V5F329_PHOLE|nr:putative membrane protein [Photobacterium leiognathi lrivu.4.1]
MKWLLDVIKFNNVHAISVGYCFYFFYIIDLSVVSFLLCQ